jgi:hypothetical protein
MVTAGAWSTATPAPKPQPMTLPTSANSIPKRIVRSFTVSTREHQHMNQIDLHVSLGEYDASDDTYYLEIFDAPNAPVSSYTAVISFGRNLYSIQNDATDERRDHDLLDVQWTVKLLGAVAEGLRLQAEENHEFQPEATKPFTVQMPESSNPY